MAVETADPVSYTHLVPADLDWLRGLRRITEQAGVALIVDEIQSGFARTGRMFAFEHAGIVPDVVVLSKAIGGSLPLAVVVYREWLDKWQPGAHAGTFRGNQMAMAAGSAVMRYLKEHDLAAHAAAMGERLAEHLSLIHISPVLSTAPSGFFGPRLPISPSAPWLMPW